MFGPDMAKIRKRRENLDAREKKILDRLSAAVTALYLLLMGGMTVGLLYLGASAGGVVWFYVFVAWMFGFMVINIANAVLMAAVLALTLWFTRN